MAVNHVLLKEFHHEKQTPYFINYTKKYHGCTVPGGTASKSKAGYKRRTTAPRQPPGKLSRASKTATGNS